MKQEIVIIFLFTILFALSASTLQAQAVKEEVEDSIKRDQMPEKALDTLDEFWPGDDRIRYYAQSDGDTETFEAKLEWKGKMYSIEFTRTGNIIDVEQLVEMQDVSSSARTGIREYLQQQFKRVKITRLQRQFIANDEDGRDDEDFIDDILEADDEDYLIRYEIEVEGRSESQIGAFELLFDSSGDLIQQRKIVRRSVDNIW